MKIIYIADDGSLFDNEFECREYEWKSTHPNLKDVRAFNEDGVELEDILSEDTYNYSTKIVVPSDDAAKEMQELARYMGYCCYESIDKAGDWVFNEKQQAFVEVSK